MRKAVFVSIPLLFAAAHADAANNINAVASLNQTQFRAVSEDVAAAISYKAVTPVAPLGVVGFDVGAEVSATQLADESAFNAACAGCGVKQIVVPRVHAHKGLPFGIDVGLSLASVPNSNVRVSAGEVRYALLEGGVATPAIGLRGTYSKLSGVDQLDMHVTGLEIGISKGFAMLTPYAGVGRNWVSSRPVGVATLSKEDFGQNKTFVGMNLNLGLMNLDFEADKTGKSETYSAKLGFRF